MERQSILSSIHTQPNHQMINSNKLPVILTDAQSEAYKGVCFYQARELLKIAGADDYIDEVLSQRMADIMSDEAHEMFCRLNGQYDPEAN